MGPAITREGANVLAVKWLRGIPPPHAKLPNLACVFDACVISGLRVLKPNYDEFAGKPVHTDTCSLRPEVAHPIGRKMNDAVPSALGQESACGMIRATSFD